MRFSTAAAIAGLPLLATAQDVPGYQAQFQNYLDKFMAYLPNPSKPDAAKPAAQAVPEAAAPAAEVPIPEVEVTALTLENWKDVLYSHVAPESTTPEPTWVFITGGNKTCFGHCEQVETEFKKAAAKFAVTPSGPHTAILDCEAEPVLCNSWSAPTSSVWIFEMLPAPAPIDIWAKRLNYTTTTSEDIFKLHQDGYKEQAKLHDGMFHPFNGWFAQNGVATPVGYVLWFFNLVPSWAFMIGISMLSRSMMSNRVNNQIGAQRGGAAAAPAAAPAQR